MIKTTRRNVFLCFGVFACILGGVAFLWTKKNDTIPLILKTEYGEFSITEPVLIDLLNDPYMQRLKKIRQYGTRYYFIKKDDYNRYDHSVGVFVLLRKHGASLHEQIAGLLHDVSHTVFSHVGDWIFKVSPLGDSYQDKIHEEFIKKTSLATVLKKHNIAVADIIHKNKEFRLLDQNIPDLCADRLEYNLKGGVLEGLLKEPDISFILNNLIVENDQWIFTDLKAAQAFAKVPLFQTQYAWSAPEEHMVCRWTSDAIEQALKIHLLTLDDIHFSTDEVVWQKLSTSEDSVIKGCFEKAANYQQYMAHIETDDYDFVAPVKFRGIDPLVKTEQGAVVRLSALDDEFKQEFDRVKHRVNAGWRIKLLSPETRTT